MISVERLIALYHERRALQSPAIGKMVRLRDHYHGDVVVPLPELDKNEQTAVANHIFQGMEQMAMRISSTSASIEYAPLRPGIRKSEEYARIRRLANYGWWQMNRFDRKQRRRARWLIGYARAPVILRPDEAKGIPKWQLRDPLCTYPSPEDYGDDIRPRDCLFTYRRNLRWLTDNYPRQARYIYTGKQPNADSMFDILEYVDCDEHVLVVLGAPKDPKDASPYGFPAVTTPGAAFAELDRTPNYAGCCTAVVPTRSGLDRPVGQFDNMPGLYALQARAMALWVISGERAIFPDTYAVSRPNETVEVIQHADGRTGLVGKVKGGDLHTITTGPPPQTAQMIDTLERNQQVGAGLPADFGGESPTNVRTGRRGQDVLSATVDFWVQEAQETLADSYEEENKVAVAISKNYFGNRKLSFYVSWKGAKGQADYVPNIHFENDNCKVSFAHAGSDANQLIVGIGQRVGLGIMSVKTAMRTDPMIDDDEAEHDQVIAEQLEKALLSSLDQAAASGQMGPLEIGRVTELVLSNKVAPWEAIQKVHNEIQAQQAAQQAAQPPPGALPPGGGPGGGPPGGGPPGAAPPPAGGPPGVQPGLMAPGLAAQQQIGQGPMNPPNQTVAAPTPSQQHFQQLLQTLGGRG